jgi:hypothetical protein
MLGRGSQQPRGYQPQGSGNRSLPDDACPGLRRPAQCRRKTDDTSPVAVDVVEETRSVAAEVVEDANPVRLEVVEDANPVTVEVVEETVSVTVDRVEELDPPPLPPLSATGATPVGESVVKNRWNGPLNPGGSALGDAPGAGAQTTTWLYLALSNSASGTASSATDAAGTNRLATSGTQKSGAAAEAGPGGGLCAGGVEGFGALGRNDAVRVGRGGAAGVAGPLAGTLWR